MSTPQQIGLFEGYGGLSMAVEDVLGAELVAYSEIDPAASKLLAHHHPGVPNLGDVTTIDWDTVHIDTSRPLIVTGGFPCQDLSLAGLGNGLRPGTRSGLWTQMAYAIDRLQPDLVVIENVRGLLSADAACDLEPCPWCLGDDEGRPLRALGAVLGDLAELGYDARWIGLRAADVGAPHGRFRVFVAAWPAADPDRDAVRDEPVSVAGCGGAALTEPAVRDPDGCDCDGWGTAGLEGETGSTAGSAADTASDGRDEGWTEPARIVGGSDAAVCGDAVRGSSHLQRERGRAVRGLGAGDEGQAGGPGRSAVQDTDSTVGGERGVAAPGQAQRGRARPDAGGRGGVPAADADDFGLGQSSTVGHEAEQPATPNCGTPPPDTGRDGREGGTERHLRAEGGQSAPHGGDAAGRVLEWGAYEPAIRRWELILGRPAPAPTQTGVRGGTQLSARFVEWLMGLPAGYVTDVPGLSRNDQLARLGNGVVPQQAAAALRHLLNVDSSAVAA